MRLPSSSADEPIPQGLVIGRNMVAPAFMPIGDGLRRRAVLQFLGLGREVDVPDIGLQRTRRRADAGTCPTPACAASAVMATCGWLATASRRASVRCAVNSVTRRSGSGLMPSSSSSSSAGAGWPPMVMTARWMAGAAGSPVTSSAISACVVAVRLDRSVRPRGGHSRDRRPACRWRRC